MAEIAFSQADFELSVQALNDCYGINYDTPRPATDGVVTISIHSQAMSAIDYIPPSGCQQSMPFYDRTAADPEHISGRYRD